MPPKPQKGGKGGKAEEKAKKKVVEDKTFGLKNKKGAKQQKFIKHVQHQTLNTGKSAKELDKQKADQFNKKKEKEELNTLFKPVEQKVTKGVDPKSVLCAFFKQGNCGKGIKCKFSHDLTIERKAAKRSMYEDTAKDDNMEDWDDDKLKDVVSKKHGEKEKKKNPTAIICKYFLDAVENSKYGWFWECPNGGADCIYRHALPPGFVLKKDKKAMEDQKVVISIEELVEKERASLGTRSLTKVTLETFLQWKDRKRKEKIKAAKQSMDKKKSDYKSGRANGLSGRDLFEFNPDLVIGDDDEADVTITRETEDDEEEDLVNYREINFEEISREAREVDNTGTVSTSSKREGTTSLLPAVAAAGNGDNKKDEEASKLDEAAALPAPDSSQNATAAAIDGDVLAADVPIDENLFDADDLELDEELETLELDD